MEPKCPLFSPGGEAWLPDPTQRCCFALVSERTISVFISLNRVKCKPDTEHLPLGYQFWGTEVRTRVEGGGLHCCVEQDFQLGGKEEMGVTCGTARLSRKPRSGGNDQPVGRPQEVAGIRPELPFWKAERGWRRRLGKLVMWRWLNGRGRTLARRRLLFVSTLEKNAGPAGRRQENKILSI